LILDSVSEKIPVIVETGGR
jgi:hypothetical protein